MPALKVMSTDCSPFLVMTYLFIYSFTRYLLVPFMWGRMVNKMNRGSYPQGALKSNLIQGCKLYCLCTAQECLAKKIKWGGIFHFIGQTVFPQNGTSNATWFACWW